MVPFQNCVRQVRVQSKIYKLKCEFYRLKCKFYRLKWEKITDQYQQIWLIEIKSNNKLETYVLLKNEFIKENYIDILDFKF
jgi:hypothetical protein